jgi:hypothetical protein
MNMAVTLPADALLLDAEPVVAVLHEPDEPGYDLAGECMKIMLGLEAIGVLAREKTDPGITSNSCASTF